MINKGFIERTAEGELRVRVLERNGEKGAAGSTPTRDLSETVLPVRNGVTNDYQDGDAVFVDWEKDIGDAMVLGKFHSATDIMPSYTMSTLEVQGKATLNQDTSIGNVSPKDIAMLQGVTSNVQLQFQKITDDYETKIKALSDRIKALEAKINA
jgi:hypothetical protein